MGRTAPAAPPLASEPAILSHGLVGLRSGGLALFAREKGEPYEEPTPTQSDRVRLDRLLIPWTDSNSLRGYCVEHLINSGVTFKAK